MLKGQKGITLVALIITIIVLIILAGVSISIALQDNGIFKKSQNGVNEYKRAEENEKIELNTAADWMQNEINAINP